MKITYFTSVDINVPGGPSTHVIEELRAMSSIGEVRIVHARTKLFNLKNADFLSDSIYFPNFRGGWRLFERLAVKKMMGMKFSVGEILYLRLSPSNIIGKALAMKPVFKVMEMNGLESAKNPKFISMAAVVDLILIGKEESKLKLIEYYPDLADKVFVHSNVGVNCENFFPKDKSLARKKLGFKSNEEIILHVSGFEWHHDFETLLTAFVDVLGKRDNVRLYLIGFGPRYEDIKILVERLGLLSHVVFVGAVKLDDLPGFIASSDVCVNPMKLDKLVHGNLNALKTYEYLSCQKPVVESCDFSLKIPQWASERLLCVPAENPTALSDGILAVLQSPLKYIDLSKSARDFVVENYSWPSVVNNTLKIIFNAMQNKFAN